MKVSFLYTAPYKSTGIPIGLSYLIALAKRDHAVSLFETTFIKGDSTELFKQFIAKESPNLLAIHTTSLCLPIAIKLIQSLKNCPVTVWGGVGPTVENDMLNSYGEVNFVCIGPGEKYLMDLLGSKWDGILPIPDWSLFDSRHFNRPFKGQIKRWGNFQLSRGCPHSCSYCVNFFYHSIGIKPFYFQPENIIKEIQILSKEYKLDIVRIFDECFGWKIDNILKFAELYHDKIGLPTIIETRPEVITPQMINILKTINCISISIGIECGNQVQRKEVLNRNVDNGTIIRAYDLLHNAGIRVSSYNIIGWPYDTEELIQDTINLNDLCKPDFESWFLATPFPKTKLREFCIKNDLLEVDYIPDYTKESIIRNPHLSKNRLYDIYETISKRKK